VTALDSSLATGRDHPDSESDRENGHRARNHVIGRGEGGDCSGDAISRSEASFPHVAEGAAPDYSLLAFHHCTDRMLAGPRLSPPRALMRISFAWVIFVGVVVPCASARAQSNDARDCLSPGRPDDVIAACTRLIDSRQSSAAELGHAYVRRGAAEANKGQLDAALRDEDAALRLDPKLVDAHMVRGTIYGAKKNFNAAISDFDAVLQIEPNNLDAHAYRGATYLQKHEIEAALRDLDAVARLDPRSSAAFYQRGMAYRLAGQHDRACRDFATAVQLAPDNPLALTDLATCYLDGLGIEKDPKRAAELLSKAAEKGFPPAQEMLTRLNQAKP
jgi:tetratricopeptide (TPR) repeat protein